jgi:hypothetical protein
MKSTDNAVEVSTTKFDGVLVTIRLSQVFLRGHSGDREDLAALPHPQTDGICDARRSRGCRSLRRVHFRSLLYLLGLRTGLHHAPCGDSDRVEVLPRRERCDRAWPVRVQRRRRVGRSRAHLRFPAGRRADTDRHGPTGVILQQVPGDEAVVCARSARREDNKGLRGSRRLAS